MGPKRQAVAVRPGVATANRSGSSSSSTSSLRAASSAPTYPESAAGGKKLTELCSSYYVKRHAKRKLTNKLASRSDAPVVGSKGNSSSSGSGSGSGGVHTRNHNQESESRSLSGNVPQVEVINGQIVLKESSLTAGDMHAEVAEYEDMADSSHNTATYFSFLRRRKAQAWGLEETKRFYEVLRQVGTEFSLMQCLFPGRTRKQLKAKFQREERAHPELIRKILQLVKPLDDTAFKVQYSYEEAVSPHDSQAQGYRRKKDIELHGIFNCEDDPMHTVIEI